MIYEDIIINNENLMGLPSKIKALIDRLGTELPSLPDEIDIEVDNRLHIFDVITNQNRLATQEDIDRLQKVEQAYGKLLDRINQGLDESHKVLMNKEVYSTSSPSYEEICNRNEELGWGVWAK